MKALVPYCLLAGLVLLFFSPLVAQPTLTLYADRSDLLAMHLPNKVFLVRSWQATGEVPLWNPYVFGGMPFAQDMQVAAFYPLYLPLYVMPEDWLGPAMSWLVVLHVMIAGWCAYAHARTYLGPMGEGAWQPWGIHLGAFVAAVGYAFAGKWMLHLLAGGHFPMLGLAWVPLVLLFLERAIRKRTWLPATLAGGAFALIILGSHPQVMFYAGLVVALWTFGPALEQAGWFGMGKVSAVSTAYALFVWLTRGLCTVVVASLLAAIQLLPNLDVIPEASRGHGLESLEGLDVAAWKATELIGPPLAEPTWEERGGFTTLWLVLAGMGLVVGPRRFWYLAFVGGVIMAFGLGASAFLHAIPGFAYFRLPGRILWFAALPVALLAGYFVQKLIEAPAEVAAHAMACRRVLVGVAITAALLVGLWALALRQLGRPIQTHAIAYWSFTALTTGVLYLLLRRHRQSWPRHLLLVLVGLLVLDLWFMSWPFVEVRDAATVYQPSRCVKYVRDHLRGHGRVLDQDLPDQPAATPLGFALPMLLSIEPVRGWHSLDVRRYKEFVQLIMDADDPLRPSELIGNFPIRNKQLLDLLGVQYVMQARDDGIGGKGDISLASDDRFRVEFEDDAPKAFGVIRSSGVRSFPPYLVFANPDAMPRAFVVHKAEELADRSRLLEQVRSTDLRRVVLLEEEKPGAKIEQTTSETTSSATIVSYHPNEITVQVHASRPGWLVLADPWYPGWTARINGAPAPVLRADFAFRAVPLAYGDKVVTLRMEPPAYLWGRWFSFVSVAIFALYWAGASLAFPNAA